MTNNTSTRNLNTDDIVARILLQGFGGRLVRVRVDGEVYDSGHHETVWNGRDDARRQRASGTYFYKLVSGGYSETKRMVLVK